MNTLCPACPGKNKCVPSDGPETCGGLYFLLEAPGWDENEKGIPLIGKTGREVNEGYFPLIGVRRSDVRVGNSIACMPVTPGGKLEMSKQQHRDLLKSCAEQHLYPELRRLKPRLIVAMGAFACLAIDPDIDLELHHGIPLDTDWGTCFPMYHPAGGIHEPKKMLHIRTDWARLRKYLRGTLKVPADQFEGAEDYGVIEDPYELNEDLAGNQDLPLACDTENTRQRVPFCLTYSIRPGRGRLIRATNLSALQQFQSFLNEWEGPILWHNWSHDQTITSKMGLEFNPRLIVDTMVRAFHLGNIPQGLKALAYRELGMAMTDFDDVVKPHSTLKVLQYYREAYNLDWPKPEVQQVRDGDKWKEYKPQSMKTKLKRFFTDYQKNEDKDVFKMWGNWADNHHFFESQLGPWPGKCITHAAEVDWPTVVKYACRDSDALLRLWPKILWMEANVRRTTQENWGDGYAA